MFFGDTCSLDWVGASHYFSLSGSAFTNSNYFTYFLF
jgi:hypothetical protein